MVKERCQSGDCEEDNNSPGGFGARHLQCIIYFFGLTIAYANRTTVSLALVAMEEEDNTGELNSNTRGLILSSFLWGYALMQVPWGYLARVWSAKMVLGIGLALNALFGILCPIVYDIGGWMPLCGCRIIMGLAQACVLPCFHTLLAKWVPPGERGRLCTSTYVGAQFGIVISYPLCGLLIDNAGWRTAFYFFGAAAGIWCMIFFMIGSDSPAAAAQRSCWGIGERERRYIEDNIGGCEGENEKVSKTPWKIIFTSIPFWALIIAHCGQNWGFWMLLTETPIYLSGVLKFDIQKNGLLSALPYVALLILTIPFSSISDWSEKKGVSRGLIRKICNSIGHWGPGLALIAIGLVPDGNHIIPVVLLVVAGGLNVGAICGFQINHMDLSPTYSGVLISITNCAASIVALIAPLVVGVIVTDTTNADQWKIVFYISGGIYFLGNLIFIIFGSGDVQWWDNSTEHPWNNKNQYQQQIRSRRPSAILPSDAIAL